MFRDDIQYLLSMEALWKKRRPPTPLDWNNLPKTGEHISAYFSFCFCVFVAVFLGCTSTGRVGLRFLWFYVQELPKTQPAVCFFFFFFLTGSGSGFKASQKTRQRLLLLFANWLPENSVSARRFVYMRNEYLIEMVPLSVLYFHCSVHMFRFRKIAYNC